MQPSSLPRTRYFLGVDGGQSSTTALIGDEQGRVLGIGRGGPCNHVRAAEGRGKFVRAIQGCLRTAAESAGLDAASMRFEAACLGFSGGPADKESILHEILRAEQMLVTHDALIALSGAMTGEPGIIVIAGTGSMGFGRNAEGKLARAGGWGYVFGDEGGGFDLARQALRAALRMEEGWGPATVLRNMLLKETGARDANDLLHRFYTTEFPRPRIAAFSKLVDEAAQAGDRIARKLLTRAAEDLSELVTAVRKQLFKPGEPVKVACIGGVFRSGRLLGHFEELMEQLDDTMLTTPAFGPAAGALIEAYRALGMRHTLSQVPEIEK
ncbi:MAG: N-acetylglucosamine kinase [Bryobacteraceae bacterium]